MESPLRGWRFSRPPDTVAPPCPSLTRYGSENILELTDPSSSLHDIELGGVLSCAALLGLNDVPEYVTDDNMLTEWTRPWWRAY
ncbi:MAG: hypothetical protein ACI9WU_003092 [Myxococcota bacterium]